MASGEERLASILRATLEMGWQSQAEPLGVLGKGGEQTVYKDPEDSDFVLKIGHLTLAGQVGFSQEPSRDELTRAEVHVALMRARHATLRDGFGPEHVPEETTWLSYVALNASNYVRLSGRESPSFKHDEIRKFWVPIRRQRLVPALLYPGPYQTRDLGVGYAERKPSYTVEQYITAGQRLVENRLGAPTDSERDWESFLAIHNNLSIARLVPLLDDSGFRTVLADFLTRAFTFSEGAGESLDLNENNVIFYTTPDSQQWDYTIVDALLPAHISYLDASRWILRRLDYPNSPLLTRGQTLDLVNSLNYTRTINALSQKLQLNNRIKLMERPSRNPHKFWTYIHHALAATLKDSA